jgi:hypothetical protein
MRRIGLHLFVIALVSLPVWGQENAQQELQHAFELNEQGQFAQGYRTHQAARLSHHSV